MKNFDCEMDYVEMNIDDMKSAKEGWQTWIRVAKRILKKIQNMEDGNQWELKSLEKSYEFFIDEMQKIVLIYSELINLAEFCDLEETYFIKKVKELKSIGKKLKSEQDRKTFKELNNKYVHGIKEAEVITNL